MANLGVKSSRDGPDEDREESRERSRMLRSAKAVGAITLLSRLTGLVRDIIQAHFLGTSAAGDAFRIALAIPSVMRRLVGEGAVQSGVVPVFSRAVQDEGPEKIQIFAEKLATLWTLALVLVTAVGVGLSTLLLAPFLLSVGADWTVEHAELAVRLNQWLFLYLIFIGLSALAQGILNSFKIFALPATTPLVFNLCFIAAGCVFPFFYPDDETTATWAFTAGILVGGVLQLVILLPSLRRRGIRLRPRWPLDHPGVREILRLLVPATLGAGVYQINAMVSIFIASTVMGGAVTSLYFSGRLVEVVLGVYVFALSTVSLTTLSQQAGSNDMAGFRRTSTEVLRLAGFITIPSTVGLMILRRPIVELILQSGRFDADSVDLTVAALVCHVPGLFFVGWSRVLVSMFYAFKDIGTPVRIAAVNLVVNATLCLLLSRTSLRHAGVALASTISVIVQCGLLVVVFRRRRGALIDTPRVVIGIARAVAAATVMGVACWSGLWLLPAESGRWALGTFVAIEIAAGAGIYFCVARVLGASEVKTILGRRRRN